MKIIDEVYPLIKCEARLSDDGTLRRTQMFEVGADWKGGEEE